MKGLANSVLIEWVNNNNHFCVHRNRWVSSICTDCAATIWLLTTVRWCISAYCNVFSKPATPPTDKLSLQKCDAAAASQKFLMLPDGSIRHGGHCLDVYNCEKTDGTPVGIYACHPHGTAECGA